MKDQQFEKILRCSQVELKKYLKKKVEDRGYKAVSQDGFLFAQGSLPVLLVAHMDTVHKEPVRSIIKLGGKWSSPQGIGGDDRCGIAVILDVLHRGLRPSVLFTEDEEIGAVGAGKFVKSGIAPDVKFIIELDRKGDCDAVYYDCDNTEFEQYVSTFGFVTSEGTFSDISVIAPHLGVAAVNFSVGYYNQHTLGEYIDLSVLDLVTRQVVALCRSAEKEKVDKFEYIPRKYSINCGAWGLSDWEFDTFSSGTVLVNKVDAHDFVEFDDGSIYYASDFYDLCVDKYGCLYEVYPDGYEEIGWGMVLTEDYHPRKFNDANAELISVDYWEGEWK